MGSLNPTLSNALTIMLIIIVPHLIIYYAWTKTIENENEMHFKIGL